MSNIGGKIGKKLIGLVAAGIVIHIIWILASLWMQRNILPMPTVVYRSFPRLLNNNLGAHMMVSLYRVFVSMGISILLGFFIGWLMGTSKKLDMLFDPILYLTYPVPKMALLPIVMLLFGLGDASKIIMIVMITLPQVILAVRDAIRNIPEHLYDIYECLQANKWQKFRYITFPASFYALLSTSRISLGTAISVLFFTETYGTTRGMGFFIMDSWMRMDYPSMYLSIIILSVMGLILFLLIDLLGVYTLRWQKTEE
ncbi:MAG: ABC transporter permease [Streptococcaceae bacterium]|jgi:NitT/TauT family transport system permease protein|nr:ABC transporter permease [Streptococcaceae bacterium]